MARHAFGWSLAALVLSASPAFAPPPPPPPKWYPATPEDLAIVKHMVGHWEKRHGLDRYCLEPFYPERLDITEADATHIVMNGQRLTVTQVKVAPRVGIDIDTPPNGFQLEGTVLQYFPLAGPSHCHYTRQDAP